MHILRGERKESSPYTRLCSVELQKDFEETTLLGRIPVQLFWTLWCVEGHQAKTLSYTPSVLANTGSCTSAAARAAQRAPVLPEHKLTFILLHDDFQFFQHHLLQRLSFPRWTVLAPLWKTSPDIRLMVLLLDSQLYFICLFVCLYGSTTWFFSL